MIFVYLTLIVWGFCFPIFSQTGPGGVGNSTTNVLWLNPNYGMIISGSNVTGWNDLSGNGNNVSQSNVARYPVLHTSDFNGNPSVAFNNNTTSVQFLAGIHSSSLNNLDGATIFAVTRFNTVNGSARCMISKRVSEGSENAFMLFAYTNNNLYADFDGTGNRFSESTNNLLPNTNYIFSSKYDKSGGYANKALIQRNGTVTGTRLSPSSTITKTSPFQIGITHQTDNRPYDGKIAEIIVYREALNATRHIIINNYLSAKFNVPLSSNDLYKQDDYGYDFEVAGIGRLSATDYHDNAKGTAILQISSPSNMDNNEFMIWGHNNLLAQAVNAVDVPSGVQVRMERVWAFNCVTTSGVATSLGTVNVTFDLAGIGAVSASDLRLLIDTDHNGYFNNNVPISGAVHLGGTLFRFNNVTISNNDRLTIGTINKIQTPLPIELIDFTAKIRVREIVDLEWEVASELNFSHYEVERSIDGYNWQLIGIKQPIETNQTIKIYPDVDSLPAAGIYYYRLKSVDLNGSYEYSPVRSVNFEAPISLIHPNPSNYILYIEKEWLPEALFSVDGKQVFNQQSFDLKENSLDISQLEEGFYVLIIRKLSGEVEKIKLEIKH